ncbi:MAG TPA: hypothetical protein PLG23_02045 [Thermoflexales bacterium]|jgi:hypothetical protein|nr:hypothetical protein [Thermoflexales bacterium]HQX09790.1 hypothetical protein [Thermoflexales bacterium]HQY23496.1 hypothetical protein [Thermoflexales bacterium]HQZ52211.1 hypothetical protein [Thermoflexales bacterium]HRA52806.1 hypothetical protein [Thermoflexales bacterium]
MNRATILIASGATVALMLAGTYVMASERATTMAQLNAEAAKPKPVVMQTLPTAALPTRQPAPRASDSLVDVIVYRAEPSDAEILVPYRSIEAEAEEPEPKIAADLPVPALPVITREAAPRAAPAAAVPQAAPPPAAQPARAAQPAPQPAPVQPRVTPPPQPPQQEYHEEEEEHEEEHHEEEEHEDHPEEHHEEEHHDEEHH